MQLLSISTYIPLQQPCFLQYFLPLFFFMLPLFMFFHLQLPYYICVYLASPNGSRYPHDISLNEVKRRNSSKANLQNPSRENVIASEYPHYSVPNEGVVAIPFGSKEYRHAKVFKYPELGGQKQAYASPNTPRIPSMVPKQPLACNEVVLGCCAENIDIMGLKGCALSFYHGENIPGLKVLLDQLTKCQPDKEMYRRCALEKMIKIAKENWKLVKLDPFLQNDKIVEDIYVLTITHAFDLLSYTKLIDVLTKINVNNKYTVNYGGHMGDHNLHGAFDGNVCFVLKMKDAENYAIFKHTYYLALYYMLKSNFEYQQPGEDWSEYKFRNTITENDDFNEDFRIIHYVEDDVRSLYGKFKLFEYIYIGLNGVNEILVFGLLAGTNLKDIVLVPHGLIHEDKAILTEVFMYIYNSEGTLVGFISHCGDLSGDLIHQLYYMVN